MTAEDRAAHVEREAVAGDDEFEDTLREVIAEHRLNAVVEGPGGLRTQVKCDGDSCDFYAEGSRYWDVVREHDAHVADAVLAALPQTGDAAAAGSPGPEHCPTCGAETAQDQCATRTGRDHPTRRLWGRAYRAGVAAQRAALTAGADQ